MLIAVFDPAVGPYGPSSNLGDLIIAEAVHRELKLLFPNATFRHYSTHRKPTARELVRIWTADLVIVGGSNLLCEDFSRFKQWKLDLWQALIVKNAVLMGVGAWQYGCQMSSDARRFFRNVLSSRAVHSVRDEYTTRSLKRMGITNIINTHCPTMWPLSGKPREYFGDRARSVLTTITDYNQSERLHDENNLRHLTELYDDVYVWPQGDRDRNYLDTFDYHLLKKLRMVPRTMAALDILLAEEHLDYVGTRLHCGIKCMNHGVRSLILSVDNRASEISKDTGLPVVSRADARLSVSRWYEANEKPSLSLNQDAINEWQVKLKAFAAK